MCISWSAFLERLIHDIGSLYNSPTMYNTEWRVGGGRLAPNLHVQQVSVLFGVFITQPFYKLCWQTEVLGINLETQL